jgi:hypothetical protein
MACRRRVSVRLPDRGLQNAFTHSSAVAAWRTLGVTDIHDGGDLVFRGVAYRGKTVTVRLKKAFARFNNGSIEWIQPLNEGTACRPILG